MSQRDQNEFGLRLPTRAGSLVVNCVLVLFERVVTETVPIVAPRAAGVLPLASVGKRQFRLGLLCRASGRTPGRRSN